MNKELNRQYGSVIVRSQIALKQLMTAPLVTEEQAAEIRRQRVEARRKIEDALDAARLNSSAVAYS